MGQKYKHIFFDFDGVLVESNTVRIEGFRVLFKNYAQDLVEQLIRYVTVNSGRSRFDKINYFFLEILNRKVNNKTVLRLAKDYSEIVKKKVIKSPPVKGAIEFLSANYGRFDFIVVSNSDQKELREICAERNIARFFKKILGSPKDKRDNIKLLLAKTGWDRSSCLLIGDSIEDLTAAEFNGIDFIARDSGLYKWGVEKNVQVIKDLTELKLV